MKKLDLEKCIGVWLDHEKAYFIKPNQQANTIERVLSNIETHSRIPGESATGMRLGNNRSSNDEYSKHGKEQEQLKHYYKLLLEKLQPYDHVVLFGSSKAKNELGNFISEHKPFHSRFLEIKGAEEMTENQMAAKVSSYFNAIDSPGVSM